MKKKIYLDYAATTPVSSEVFKVMKPYFFQDYGNPSEPHLWGQKARFALDKARQKMADFLGAKPQEIIFTSGATEAINLAHKGVVEAMFQQSAKNKEYRTKGKLPHIITSQIEHKAVLETCKHLEKLNWAKVTYLPVDKDGLVDLRVLEKAIRPETVLVSVMYVNNEVGTIQPIEEMTQLLKAISSQLKAKIYFHTDAAAVAEYLTLDVKKLGVDLMTLGSHKFGGPKGVGILYLKKLTQIDPLTFGGHHERGLWPGTEAVPLIVGMAEALRQAQGELTDTNKRVSRLKDKLIKGVLEKIPETILTGHPEKRLADMASFCFKGAEGEAILLRLDAEGIAASSGSACTSGTLQPSHVLLAMGIPAEIAHGSIRFSLGRETTEEEIDYVLEKLPKIIKEIREMAPKL